MQRVKRARVEAAGRTAGEVGKGLLVFLGVGREDTEKEGEFLANKIAHLRIFSDEQGLMNRSVIDVEGGMLVVSQFTLWGIATRGGGLLLSRPRRRKKPGRCTRTLSAIFAAKG